MALQLVNLDDRTKQLMLDEFEKDANENNIYISDRLSDRGRKDYISLLREAIKSSNEVSLAKELCCYGRMNTTEQRRTTKGGVTTAKIPITAPDTLAEGEFNRFYIRGLCRRAIEDNIQDLVIYRAKEVKNPRPESEAMVGRTIDAKMLLDDLRSSVGVETALRVPPGPNSGLSARLP